MLRIRYNIAQYRFYIVLLFLLAFLIVRYTKILFALGFPEFEVVTGISTNPWLSILIIVAFFIIGLVLVKKGLSLFEKFKKYQYYYYIPVFVVVLAIFIFGAFRLADSTDELRDVAIFNIVNEHTLNAYLTDEYLTQNGNQNQGQLRWAQYLHPPLQYMLAHWFTDGQQSVPVYRLLFIGIFLVIGTIAIFSFKKLGLHSSVLLLACSLILTYSYFRNYQIIRVGNEMSPFITFNGLCLILGFYYIGKIKINFLWWVLMIVLMALTIWFKFSFIVALLGLLGSFVISFLIKKDIKILKAGGILLMVSLLGMLLYVWAYHDSYMGQEQAKYYTHLFTSKIPFLPTTALDLNQYQTGSSSSVPKYIYSFIFWYGPVIPLFVSVYFLGVIKKQIKFNTLHLIVVIWLLIAIFGTLLVNPRATYTAPFTIAFLFLCITSIKNYFKAEEIPALASLLILFGCTEVLLLSV